MHCILCLNFKCRDAKWMLSKVVPGADISSGTLLKEFSQKFPRRSLLLVLAKFQGMSR